MDCVSCQNLSLRIKFICLLYFVKKNYFEKQHNFTVQLIQFCKNNKKIV